MKKIFLGLCAATVLFGIHETVVDVLNNDFTDDSITVIVFLTLVAGLFTFLAWLFDGKSPVDRALEQTKNAVQQEQEKQEEYTNYSPAIKRRIWKFRIWGLLLIAAALWICVNWHWEEIPVYFATVVLIVGIAVFGMGSPADYNAMTDSGAMLAMDSPRKIEEFYRAFRSIDTPLGSGWLGKFTTSPKESLIFGPNSRGEFLYFFLSGDGLIGYLGNSMLPSTISQRLEDPDYPPKEETNGDLYEHLCYHADLFLMRDWLQKSLEHFVKTGTPLPLLGLQPSQIYTFSEDFKLTGQHFTVENAQGKTVYTVDGTAPLVTLRVRDMQDKEVFTMTKQLGHPLPVYKFYQEGTLYGTLEKQLDLVRDRFTMETTEGTLELREYAGTIGRNFKVTLNGQILGAIMENMDLTPENIVFDNAFLIVYRPEKLPLLVAMAVMAARELARDRDT